MYQDCRSKTQIVLANIYLITLVIYYGIQKQVDFAVFWSAGRAFIKGQDPYSLTAQEASGWHMFINAPTSLIFFGVLGLCPLIVASFLFRIVSILTIYLVARISHSSFGIPKHITYSVFLLSVPFRTTIGSGQVGLIVLLAIVKLISLIYQNDLVKNKRNFMIGTVCCFSILSFKPYMFIGIAILLLVIRKINLLLISILSFVFVTICMSLKFNLIKLWLSNVAVVGELTLEEANNSSIIAFVNRISNQQWLAIIFYITINALIVCIMLTKSNDFLRISLSLCLSITLSPYIHHQDYLVTIMASLLVCKFYSNSEVRKFESLLGVGLQPNSLVFTFIYEIWRFAKRDKVNYSKIISMIAIFLTCFNAICWHVNKLNLAFFVYDGTYIFWVLILTFITLSKSRKITIY
ncbi:MAG: hypothetical protein RL193_823 [Actinomycetota bacterium]|jgi:hypothetical protein